MNEAGACAWIVNGAVDGVMPWLGLFILAFVLLSLAMVRAAAASGGASDGVETDQSTVRLLAASETAANAEEVALGLQIRLTEGWKTYGRSPGEAGYPAQIDWIGGENLTAADIVWRGAPHVRPEDGGKEGGYRVILSLPISGTEFLRSPLTGSPVTLALVGGARAVERRLAVGATGTGGDVLSHRGSADRAPVQAPGGLPDPRQ